MGSQPRKVDNAMVHQASLLIVDDSATELLAIRKALEGTDFQVFTCQIKNLSEILRLTELGMSVEPDLILMDVDLGLGSYDGVKLVRTVRKLRAGPEGGPGPLVVLHSSLPGPKLEALREECGADSYLQKGDPQLLPLRVQTLLSLHRVPSTS